MNQENANELESLVKSLFVQSRKRPETNTKTRLTSILKRSLHELAMRDLLLLSAHLIQAMFSMLALYIKLLSGSKHQPLRQQSLHRQMSPLKKTGK